MSSMKDAVLELNTTAVRQGLMELSQEAVIKIETIVEQLMKPTTPSSGKVQYSLLSSHRKL